MLNLWQNKYPHRTNDVEKMINDFTDFLKDFKRINKGKEADDASIDAFLNNIDFIPPADYMRFMKACNGLEGLLGNGYIKLWPLEELIDINNSCDVDKYAEGFFVFGTDLGGTAYAFNKTSLGIFQFEFVGMLINDEPIFCGSTFFEFFEYIKK